MKDIIIIRSIFLFMSVWGVALILLWFRPRMEIIWKIGATVILGFYVWFFWDEIARDFLLVKTAWYTSLVTFFRDGAILVYANLFLFWPVTLVVIFYKSDDIGAERLLKFMILLTLVLWLMFVAYFYFDSGISRFFNETLKKMIPYAR